MTLEEKIDAYLKAQKPGESRAVQFFNFSHEDHPVTCAFRLESESSVPRITFTSNGDGGSSTEAFDIAMKDAIAKFGEKL